MTPVNNPSHGFLLIAGVVDTGDKFLTCDNDTYDKFITGDNDIGEQIYCQWQEQGRHGDGELPRRKLKGTNRWYLRPPKSDTTADGVIGTTMKSCIHRHPTNLIRDPWGREN